MGQPSFSPDDLARQLTDSRELLSAEDYADIRQSELKALVTFPVLGWRTKIASLGCCTAATAATVGAIYLRSNTGIGIACTALLIIVVIWLTFAADAARRRQLSRNSRMAAVDALLVGGMISQEEASSLRLQIDNLFATAPPQLREAAVIEPMSAAEKNQVAAVEAIENRIAQGTIARWSANVERIDPVSFKWPIALITLLIAAVVARHAGYPLAARLMLILMSSLFGVPFLAFGVQIWLTGYLVFQLRRATNHKWMAAVGLLLYFLGGAGLVAMFLSAAAFGFKVRL